MGSRETRTEGCTSSLGESTHEGRGWSLLGDRGRVPTNGPARSYETIISWDGQGPGDSWLFGQSPEVSRRMQRDRSSLGNRRCAGSSSVRLDRTFDPSKSPQPRGGEL